MQRLSWLAILIPVCLLAQQPSREEPVGVFLSPGGAKVIRQASETALAARPGDILFDGDTVRAEAGSATFLYCPTSVSQTLQPNTMVLLQSKQMKVKSGSLGPSQPVSACRLPSMVRVAVASQQHYGVTMVRALRTPQSPTQVATSALPPEVAIEIQAIGSAKDPAAGVARGTVYEKSGLLANAMAEYSAVAAEWPDAVWIKGKIFELQEQLAAEEAKKASAGDSGGQTFAVLVGISKYQKLPQDLWLQYANADATALQKHLLSPRGGNLPPDNVVLLTDERATTAALRSVLQTFKNGRAGKKDTVILFLAGHGTVEVPGSKAAFILTHDSDPQDLTSTSLPMLEIQELIQQLTEVGRVMAFVDVCRSGTIGTIKSTSVNAVVERLGESEGEMLGLMASRPRELSYEGPQFGGGHGAFSYYLLKALTGDADKNKDNVVNVNELIEYVRQQVAEGTDDKQHPRDFGNIDNTAPLSDLTKTGVEVSHYFRVMESGREPAYLASAAAALPQSPADLSAFSDALAGGRLLPGQAGNAFDLLRNMRRQLSPDQYLLQENRLRVALEDRAQQVLLRYLAGDEVPQNRVDFSSAADLMAAAKKLTPESLYLDARESFFEGRALLFDKQYSKAADSLERCVRLDPAGAYAYNALGIAYLEQGEYERALPAFRDAIARAPHWAYPVHNLALGHFEMGDYESAIRHYKEAIRLRPDVSYLPYNLGLVYQRLNLSREAQSAYRRAMALAPNSGEPLNALGSLKTSTGDHREAETLFRQALEKNPNLFAARHNLAVVVAREKARHQEAVQLWRTNLGSAPDHLPSLLGLAELLDNMGDLEASIDTYKTILRLRPEYVAARLALSDLFQRRGNLDDALREATAAAATTPGSPAVLERIGDLHSASGNEVEAVQAYEQAVAGIDNSGKKRLQRKLKRLKERVPSARRH